MKKLKVDIDEIALAMEAGDPIEETVWYLDTETGEVINVFEYVIRDLKEGNEEAIEDYPDWMEDMVEQAKALMDDDKGRFVDIPKISSDEAYRVMEDFILSIEDKNIRNKLSAAIRGRGAFRRFKDTISEWPDLEKDWYKFKDESVRREVLDWFESIGIEPDE